MSKSRRDRNTGSLFRRPGSANWWIAYRAQGKQVRESAKTTNKTAAQKLLNRRLAEARTNKPAQRDFERIMFGQLVELYVEDFRARGCKSKMRTAHLLTAFGESRVVDINGTAIRRYVAHRREAGAKPATINRELSALKRMLKLGVEEEPPLVDRIPKIAMQEESNCRRGFMEPDEFEALRAHLPEHLRVFADVAYYTGWRKSELLSRMWRHIDFDAGILRLEPGESKNGEGREFPFSVLPPLRESLEWHRKRRIEVARQTGRTIDALFFFYDGKRAGQPVKSLRKAWWAARRAAGMPERLVHDFRRTAARNLRRAGVAESDAMKLTGHLTAEVFRRYAIQDDITNREAVAKLAEYHEARTATMQRKVAGVNEHSLNTVSRRKSPNSL